MALNIKHPDADRLARELAARTGESLTDAVLNALRERLRREEAHRNGRRFVVNSRKSGRGVPHYRCLTRGVRRKLSGTTNADCRANPLITSRSTAEPVLRLEGHRSNRLSQRSEI
jgi:antitoxin VapB